ncbi:hypothetical protein ACSLOB_29925, partial [Escherichia coli]
MSRQIADNAVYSCFVGLAWRSDEFLTFGNLYDLANNYAMLTILACGLFVVLISGG